MISLSFFRVLAAHSSLNMTSLQDLIARDEQWGQAKSLNSSTVQQLTPELHGGSQFFTCI